MMNDKEILDKYGDIELEFDHLYKRSVSYFSKDKKYRVVGELEHRCEITKDMTVRDVWQEVSSFIFHIHNETI